MIVENIGLCMKIYGKSQHVIKPIHANIFAHLYVNVIHKITIREQINRLKKLL